MLNIKQCKLQKKINIQYVVLRIDLFFLSYEKKVISLTLRIPLLRGQKCFLNSFPSCTWEGTFFSSCALHFF